MLSLAKALAGKWSVIANFGSEEAIPNVASGKQQSGGTGSGEEFWRLGPGGFTFIDEEDIRAPFGEVFLVGFVWWDATTHSFRGMECTSQNPRGCDVQSSLQGVSLKWDGKQLVIDMDTSENGKKMIWHEVWSDITANSFTQTGYMGEAGGPLKRAVTIHGTRIADNSKESSK
jgi:hypothetical protein